MFSQSVVLVLLVRAAAVASENSDRMISRKKFLLWLAGWFMYSVFIGAAFEILAPSEPMPPVSFWVLVLIFIGGLGYSVYYYRAMVRRLRDAGHSKKLAYIAIVPIIDFLVSIYLLIAGPLTPEERAKKIARATAPLDRVE